MTVWNIIWGIVIAFSVVSFTAMSIKILYKAVAELKEMFKTLKEH